jgi:hypothetical protein
VNTNLESVQAAPEPFAVEKLDPAPDHQRLVGQAEEGKVTLARASLNQGKKS